MKKDTLLWDREAHPVSVLHGPMTLPSFSFVSLSLKPSGGQALGGEPRRNPQPDLPSCDACFPPFGPPLREHTAPKASPRGTSYPWSFKAYVFACTCSFTHTASGLQKNLRGSEHIYECPMPSSSLTCFSIVILMMIISREEIIIFFFSVSSL